MGLQGYGAFLSLGSSKDVRFYLRSFVFVVLCLWLISKSFLFQGLEYTSDLFSFLQMSRISLERGMLFENAWGRMGAIHNFYTVLLFAPVTFFLGAYGLFLGTALLYLFALWKLISLPDEVQSPPNKFQVILLTLGPIGFWLFDDPIYGWHLELNFVPLSILLTTFLLTKNRIGSVITALLFVFTKEDGPVLACMICLTYEIVVRTDRRDGGTFYERMKVPAKICAVWVIVFALGLLWLHLQKTYLTIEGQADYSDRLAIATKRFLQTVSNSGGIYSLWSMYPASLLMILSAILVFAPANLKKIGLVYLVSSVPLYIVVLIPSFAYAGTYHGLLWPPRFSLLWGLAISIVIFLGAKVAGKKTTYILQGIYLILLGASVFLQIQALRYYRNYSYADRMFAPFTPKSELNLIGARLSPMEHRFIECIATQAKKPSPILTEGSLFAIFHRHDIVFPARIRNAWAHPVLAVCDLQRRLPFNEKCLEFVLEKKGKPDWHAIQEGSIIATGSDPTAKNVLSNCATRLGF